MVRPSDPTGSETCRPGRSRPASHQREERLEWTARPLRPSAPPSLLYPGSWCCACSRAACQGCHFGDRDPLGLRRDQHACVLFTFELCVCFGLLCLSRGRGWASRTDPSAPGAPCRTRRRRWDSAASSHGADASGLARAARLGRPAWVWGREALGPP